MRYQEPIYIQNQNSAVRNKDINNVNMSSDICIFAAPLFGMTGATKLDCSGYTGTTHVITTATTIPLYFNFTGNTGTFTANTPTFNYEIYKFNHNANKFSLPSVYKSDTFQYSGFSGTSIISQNIPVSGLSLDGDYLIKGYYQYSACTDFLGKLGKTVDTLTFRHGSEYGLYDNALDYYFIAFKGAEEPKFLINGSEKPPLNQLFQQVILPEDNETVFTVAYNGGSEAMVTLNGLVLAKNLDYTLSDSVLSLSASTVKGDVLTIVYTAGAGNNLIGENINITSPITSGATGQQGNNLVYYNTGTTKYEIYTTIEPINSGSIMVMLNGASLANGIDFYQSSSDPKRIILEGVVMVGDIITIVYAPTTGTVNGITNNFPAVSWQISTPPQTTDGIFTLEISTGTTFSTFYSSITQSYVVGQTNYYQNFIASGSIGTKLYYRIKNEKKYETLCGIMLSDIKYSETIPITIQTNSINSY
jgi:hypothetical protein